MPDVTIPALLATDPRVQSLSEADQRRYFMLLILEADGKGVAEVGRDVQAFALRIGRDELDATLGRIDAAGLLDEQGRPATFRKTHASGYNAERQRRYRERKRASKGEAEPRPNRSRAASSPPSEAPRPRVWSGSGSAPSAAPDVTRYGNAPQRALRNALQSDRNAPVTRVTAPPQSPPNKSLNLDSHIQTDRHALLERALPVRGNAGVTSIESGSWAIEEDAKLPPPACTEEQTRKVVAILCRHLDPLGLSDVWARQFRSWAQTYDEPMLLALIPRVVEQVVKHPRTRTGWAGAILEDWARDGVPAERSEAAAGRVVKSTVAAADTRVAAPKPPTEHQRKMAACLELAYGPKLRKEADRG